MITRQDIEKLANLSRLKLSPEEIDRFQGEIGAILSYVDKLKTATTGASTPVMSGNKNVLRDDNDASCMNEGGAYTEKLLSLAPRREGPYIKVKKILQ